MLASVLARLSAVVSQKVVVEANSCYASITRQPQPHGQNQLEYHVHCEVRAGQPGMCSSGDVGFVRVELLSNCHACIKPWLCLGHSAPSGLVSNASICVSAACLRSRSALSSFSSAAKRFMIYAVHSTQQRPLVESSRPSSIKAQPVSCCC